MSKHQPRVAVVTGAARGIGQAIAVRLAEMGAHVAGIDRGDLSETASKVTSAGAPWLGLSADVSSESEVSAAAKSILDTCKRCDILVNNAGVFSFASFDTMTSEEWRRVLSINLDSQFFVSRAFVGSMKENGWGRIINFTSDSAEIPAENLSAYKASKMGAIGLTRGMASDLGRYGITVNAISPALTRTPGALASNAADTFELAAGMQAIKRTAEPADMLGLVAFLAGEESHFVTGQTIFSNGGLAYK